MEGKGKETKRTDNVEEREEEEHAGKGCGGGKERGDKGEQTAKKIEKDAKGRDDMGQGKEEGHARKGHEKGGN